MNDINSMAHLMYALECMINQNKPGDWDEQPESVQDEWRESAKRVYRLCGGEK